MSTLAEVFPRCRSLLAPAVWRRLTAGPGTSADSFPDVIEQQGGPGIPPFLPGLARIELARCTAAASREFPLPSDSYTLNPSLQLTPVRYSGLPLFFDCDDRLPAEMPEPGDGIVMTWRIGDSGRLWTRAAQSGDLLAIKLVAEDADLPSAAREASVPVGTLDAVLRAALRDGLILSPSSGLRREPTFPADPQIERFMSANVFTLQWHLTQTCDLHCRHCYDRSRRSDFPFERALTLLDELRSFCCSRFIRGQVSFSGGNPLLYPRFFELYRAAAEYDFMIAILGNAVEIDQVQRLIDVRMPVYYQVSLEGLEEHNDRIRGQGNFRRTVDFLHELTRLGVPNMVMLTLTRHNMDQVLPLAKALEGVTGGLTFNRLALFGEGAALELPGPAEYRLFLERYAAALEHYPVLTLKESLLNTIFEADQSGLFGGCAGHGCGAAFNFVSILSDGEVHACRKFPSYIGSIIDQSLEAVYASDAAARYRRGSSACDGCSLNAVCRGCPAVTASLGLRPLSDKDPFCFK